MEYIIRVHRPTLTDEERARRMKLIGEAAVQLIKATEQAKRDKYREQLKTQMRGQ